MRFDTFLEEEIDLFLSVEIDAWSTPVTHQTDYEWLEDFLNCLRRLRKLVAKCKQFQDIMFDSGLSADFAVTFSLEYLSQFLNSGSRYKEIALKVIAEMLKTLCNSCVGNVDGQERILREGAWLNILGFVSSDKCTLESCESEIISRLSLLVCNYSLQKESAVNVFLQDLNNVRAVFDAKCLLDKSRTDGYEIRQISCWIFEKVHKSSFFESIEVNDIHQSLLLFWQAFLVDTPATISKPGYLARDISLLEIMIQEKKFIVEVLQLLAIYSESNEYNKVLTSHSDGVKLILGTALDQCNTETSRSRFGFRSSLIKLIANTVYNSYCAQEFVRTYSSRGRNGLYIVLNATVIDDNNPYIREWSILAIRNLTEDNLMNQNEIAKLKQQSPRQFKAY